MPESCEIPFEVVRQYPELPNGCEVTSLAMVLGHLGFTVSKVALKNDYRPLAKPTSIAGISVTLPITAVTAVIHP